jgi:hypothetical protein
MKYRIKKVTQSSIYRSTNSVSYYPQERRWYGWCYFINAKEENRTNIVFYNLGDAWEWITQRLHLDTLETKVEYIYESSTDVEQ